MAIIEEDVLTRDLAEGNDGLQLLYKNMASLRQAMKQEPQWQTVRAGTEPCLSIVRGRVEASSARVRRVLDRVCAIA